MAYKVSVRERRAREDLLRSFFACLPACLLLLAMEQQLKQQTDKKIFVNGKTSLRILLSLHHG
jgi:hypothetical protein